MGETIDLRDIAARFLRKLGPSLILFLLGFLIGAAIAGIAAYKETQRIHQANLYYDTYIIKEPKKREQDVLERRLQFAQKQLEQTELYFQNSILLTLNPGQVALSEDLFYVFSDRRQMILNECRMLGVTQDAADRINARLGTAYRREDIAELFTFELNDAGCVHASAIATDEATSDLLLEEILGDLREKTTALFSAYTTRSVRRETTIVMMSEVQERYLETLDRLSQLRAGAQELSNQLASSLPKKSNPPSLRDTLIAVSQVALRYGILFLATGFALMFFFDVVSVKVADPAEYEKKTGTRLLGLLSFPDRRSRGRVSILRRAADRLEGKVGPPPDAQEQLGILRANLRSAIEDIRGEADAPAAEAIPVLVTSTMHTQEELQRLCEGLSEAFHGRGLAARCQSGQGARIEGDGWIFLCEAGLRSRASAVEWAARIPYAMVVETVGRSVYPEIEASLRQLRDLNCRVLGSALMIPEPTRRAPKTPRRRKGEEEGP